MENENKEFEIEAIKRMVEEETFYKDSKGHPSNGNFKKRNKKNEKAKKLARKQQRKFKK